MATLTSGTGKTAEKGQLGSTPIFTETKNKHVNKQANKYEKNY